MLMLITLLNDGTLISIGYDNVIPSTYPNVWNLRVVFVVSSVLAFIALLSSLLLLYICLDSWNPGSVFHLLGLSGLSYGQITTAIYLKVSISDFLTLFSARTHDGYFYSSSPSWILLLAALFALSLSTVLACFWPESTPDGIPAIGLLRVEPKIFCLFIWLYCVLWWFLQDISKVFTYFLLQRYNIFGINDTLMIGTGLKVESNEAIKDDGDEEDLNVMKDERKLLRTSLLNEKRQSNKY